MIWLLPIFVFLGSLFFLTPEKKGESDWMERSIARDFKRFEKEGISKELLETTWKSCQKHPEFHRYQVIDSQVFGPDSRIKILLEEMVKRYSVPNVDFIYYYEDRIKKSFFHRSSHRKSAPLFASAKDASVDQVILFADWNYDISDSKGGWNGLIEQVNRAVDTKQWGDREGLLFWRGTPWDGKHFGMYTFENWNRLPRGHLVELSQKFPNLIDARFSEYPKKCVQKDKERCVGEMGEIGFVPWERVFSYKYQILIDGVTCSFPATQWKLLSGALCFKQTSPDIQYYYDGLIPWKHYIPVKNDLSDLLDKLSWAKTHDKEAEIIAQAGREFVLTHLMPEHILLYCYKVLLKYASLQRFDP